MEGIKLEVVLSFILRALLLLSNVAIGVFLARFLGVEGFGHYSIIMSVIAILVVIFGAGMNVVTMREVSKALSVHEFSRVRGVLVYSLVKATLLSSLVSIMVVAMFKAGVLRDFGGLKVEYYYAIFLLPLLVSLNIISDYIRGMRSLFKSQVIVLLRQLLFGVSIIVLWLMIGRVTVGTAIELSIASIIAACVVGIIFVVQTNKKLGSFEGLEFRSKEWSSAGLSFLLVGVFQVINNRADSLMLGLLTGGESAGIYEVGFRVAELILFLQIAVSIVLAPRLGAYFEDSSGFDVNELIHKSQRVIVLFSFPVFLILLVFCEPIITWVFGSDYHYAVPVCRILLIAHLINLLTGPSDLILNMAGKQSITVHVVVVVALSNVLLNLVLIPRYGIMGAAIATLMTNIFWNFALWYKCVMLLDINSSYFGSFINRGHE